MARDKIILIHVGTIFDNEPQRNTAAPWGIIYLGSYLISRGYPAVFMDTRLKDRNAFFADLSKELRGAALVGLSVTTPLTREGLEITKFIKTKDPSIPVIWGGFHATLYPESTLNNKYIDFNLYSL